MNFPKISVVIPVYNGEKYLNETLQSVYQQTFDEFECIIINDGSTDNTLEIIDHFEKIDKRFRHISIKNSGCANIPRIIGVMNSHADLVFNLDSDDLIEANCLSKIYSRQKETNADIVLLTVIGYRNELDEEFYRLPIDILDKEKIYSGYEICSLTIGGWQISCNGMLARKKLYNNISEGNLLNSDELTSRYILLKANKVTFAETFYHYRNRSDSISKKITAKIFEKLIVDRQLNEFIDLNYGVESNIAQRIRRTRFFNLIYWQDLYFKNNFHFTYDEKIKVKNILLEAFKSQNFFYLRKELHYIYYYLFLSQYQFFKFNSVIYMLIKTLKGKKYIVK
ncbi:MAG TPA: glycosyltransferase family 2 protein [Exilispira sp.]|jgi:glycosyltransferase involved in cell wall biosynthesis|nr:glycosyltransferase family 2 protein [Exilispira sp.]